MVSDCAGDFMQNDERVHYYQRGRASITGLMVETRQIIETERLVVVVTARLVLLLILACGSNTG